MSHKNHRPTIRTTGGKHRWKHGCWLPTRSGSMTKMFSGAKYRMDDAGWRRIGQVQVVTS